MPEAVIVSAARSPIGRANKGSLKDVRPDDLAALVVGGQASPVGLLQFGALGIIVLLVVIWLGNRRAARS